jgi:hypothetical protein
METIGMLDRVGRCDRRRLQAMQIRRGKMNQFHSYEHPIR